jgi:hypothetical protein
MSDVAAPSVQQWTFTKPERPERSTSMASSPDMSYQEPETMRIDASIAAAVRVSQEIDSDHFQDRYLSSEEDLSPTDGNSSDSEYDSDASIHDDEKEVLKAKRLSVSRWDKGLSCDMAVLVSYKRMTPKVVELAQVHQKTQRSASLAQLPITAIENLRKDSQRHRSMLLPSSSPSTTRSSSPVETTSRRQSFKSTSFSYNNASHVQLSEYSISLQSNGSTRSSSSLTGFTQRPASSAQLQPRVSSLSNAKRSSHLTATPQSTDTHSFLNSDPFESSTRNAASPIISNSGPHRRLRSISMKLSLAKIAITPSTKKWDSRINGKQGTMPMTPTTPMTPQTAPPTTESSPMRKVRRNSRILLSRPPTRGAITTPDLPTISSPKTQAPLKRIASENKVVREKLVARGANEREAAFELPPFPHEEPVTTVKPRLLRKRKSIMDLL